MDSKYYPSFDYLRFVLAATVALGHSGISIWDQSGNYAVQVFFAMSGWLIGGILLRSKPRDFPRFYFNRAARIWIPYYVSIIPLILVSLLKDRITAKWLEIFFYDFTFVYNVFGPPQLATSSLAMPLEGTGNHFWSICAEEQFYLLAPFLIALPRGIGRTIWFWGIVAIAVLSSPLWQYFGSVSLGVFAAIVRLKLGGWHINAASRAVLATLWAVFFAATYWVIIPYRIGAPVSAICIVLFFAQPGVRSRLASFLGGVSYPMYLNHWIGAFAAHAIFRQFSMRDSVAAELSSVLIAFAVAAILYWVVDQNVREKRDEYFTEFRGKAVAVCGFALVALGLTVGCYVAS
jgi:peptidoglycan/LPS O-acetylase OafA/YrhL